MLLCATHPAAWSCPAEQIPERIVSQGQPATPETAVQTAPATQDLPELTPEELKALQEALAIDAADQAPALNTAMPSLGNANPMTSSFATGAVPLQSANPDIAFILDTAGSWFSDEPQQLGAHDPNRTGFTLQQLEMSIGSNVDPFFRMDANLVFSQFGVEVEEAYGTTLALPHGLQVRMGQLLTRFGRLNNTHPHSWHFLDQPLVNGKFFGGEGSRGLGAEISWLSPLPWFAELVFSTTDAAGACCARSFYGGDDLGVEEPIDLLATTALKQFFPFDEDWSLAWGLSGQLGPNPTGNGNRSMILGTDLYLRYRPVASAVRSAVSLQVESMYRSRQTPGDRLEDWGAYAQLVWNINLRWETGARYEYVTGALDDFLDPEWTEDRQRITGQITYYPSHFSRLRLQASEDRLEWLDEPIYAVMFGTEVLIGAHGSHGF
ncbi:MAG: zinc-regulated TonB-dependent outer membrane receptor [Bradymonadia bacterium]